MRPERAAIIQSGEVATKQGFLMYYTKGVVIGTEVSVRYRESGRLSGVVVKRGSTVHPFSSWLLEPCVFVGIIARLLSLSLSLSLSQHICTHTHFLFLMHAHSLSLSLSPSVQVSHTAVMGMCRAHQHVSELYPSRELALCLDPYSGLAWCSL